MHSPNENRCHPEWQTLLFLGAFVLVLWLGSACARVADPVPPQISIPKRTTELLIRQDGLKARLSLPRPLLNVDGSEVRKLKEIRIYRLVRIKDNGDSDPVVHEPTFKNDATLLAVLPVDNKSDFNQEGRLLFDDPLPLEEGTRVLASRRLFFAVEFVNHKGQSDGLSNIVILEPHAIPLAPKEIRTAVYPDRLHLEWDLPTENMDGSRPPCISGYWLYRSFSNPPQFETPLNPKPIPESFFDDPNPIFGKEVFYTLRVVGCSGSGSQEGALSVPVTLIPKDIFPPAIPRRLEAFGLPTGISLRWDVNPETDLAGYWLYRSNVSDSIGQKLTTQPIRTNNYQDNTAEDQITYYYRLSAVDQLGNESKATDPVSCSREMGVPPNKE